MPYRKWEQIEEKYKKSMRDVLIQLYEEHGDHKAVAKELGVTLKGLREWRNATGCQSAIRLICHKSESTPDDAGDQRRVGAA